MSTVLADTEDVWKDVFRKGGQVDQVRYNALNVRLELQADCLASAGSTPGCRAAM